jgi:hypothetical protein
MKPAPLISATGRAIDPFLHQDRWVTTVDHPEHTWRLHSCNNDDTVNLFGTGGDRYLRMQVVPASQVRLLCPKHVRVGAHRIQHCTLNEHHEGVCITS